MYSYQIRTTLNRTFLSSDCKFDLVIAFGMDIISPMGALFCSFVKNMNIYELNCGWFGTLTMEMALQLRFSPPKYLECKLHKQDRKTIKSVIRFTNCVQLHFGLQEHSFWPPHICEVKCVREHGVTDVTNVH